MPILALLSPLAEHEVSVLAGEPTSRASVGGAVLLQITDHVALTARASVSASRRGEPVEPSGDEDRWLEVPVTAGVRWSSAPQLDFDVHYSMLDTLRGPDDATHLVLVEAIHLW